MNRELLVYVDLPTGALLAGRLWTRSAPREGASFEYEPSWRSNPLAFALDPELPLAAGQFHTSYPLFRAFTDPAPDRWGQTLLRRAERARARREGRTPRTLTAVDFLILVDDQTRLGALRFRDASAVAGTPFLTTTGRPVPPLVELPRLLAATGRFVADEESEDDMALLLAPGTSLGGARPKASVRGPDGSLFIAKFPRKDDDWPVTRWEAATLSMAASAAIQVTTFSLPVVARKPVLLLPRFDRDGTRRIPFMSAMTALGADDDEPHGYLDVLDAIRQQGSHPGADASELWRRLVFNVLVSNTDDHLRNHAFLHDGAGWRLAPAYDLNPTPLDVKPRVHALTLDESDATASMDTAFAVAPRFGLSATEAKRLARSVAGTVKSWRKFAAKQGLRPGEMDRMASAFEHEDLEIAAG